MNNVGIGATLVALVFSSCDIQSTVSEKEHPDTSTISSRTLCGGVNSITNPQAFNNRVGATVQGPILNLRKISPLENPIVEAQLNCNISQSLKAVTVTSMLEWTSEVTRSFGSDAGASILGVSVSGNFSSNIVKKMSFSANTVNGIVYQLIPGPIVKLEKAALKPEALAALSNPANFSKTFGSAIATEVQLGGWFAGCYRWTKKASSNISMEEVKTGMSLRVLEIANGSLSYSQKSELTRISSHVDEVFEIESSLQSGSFPWTTLDKNNIVAAANFFGDYYQKAWRGEPYYYFSDMSIKWSPLSSVQWTNIGTNSTKLAEIGFKDPNEFGLDSVGMTRNVSQFKLGLNIGRRGKFISNVKLFYTIGNEERFLRTEYFYNPTGTGKYLAEILAKEQLRSEDLQSLGSIKFKVVPTVSVENKWWDGLPATFTMNANRGDRISSVDDGLFPNDYLQSQNKLHTLIMQGDGNLVNYGLRTPWANRKIGLGLQYLALEGNGYIVTRTVGNGSLTWNTNGGGSFLLMQDDGNVVLYNSEYRPVWARWGM